LGVSPNKKMGWAIIATIVIATVVAVWNVYVALLLLPLVFAGGIFLVIGITVAKSVNRDRSSDLDAAEESALGSEPPPSSRFIWRGW
jgi:hypothetical protein